MNILITGSDGFIAKELIYFFNQDNEHTLITRNRHQLDLLKKKNVDAFFEWNKGKIDIVIHCASKGGSRFKNDNIEAFFDNINMFKNILDNVQKYNLLLFNFTSGAEYFDGYNMDSPYGASKSIISSTIKTIKKNIINLKIFNCFGKYGLSTRFIEGNIDNYINGNDIIIHQDRYFDFFYSEDVYKIICYFIRQYKNGEVNTNKVNCIYDSVLTLSDVAEIINNIDDKKINIKIIDKDLGDDYIGNDTWDKLNEINIIGLKEGIRRIYVDKIKKT